MQKLIFLFLMFPAAVLAQGFLCAVGGGGEDYKSWSDQPYQWIVEKAGKGPMIILSADTETEWIPDYFKSFGALSAVNLKIATRTTADLQSTYDAITSASAVFIKGGDQWDYVSLWKGTKTEDAIRKVWETGGVVSGTSAGAMVLGELVFSAKNGSVYPAEALKNPWLSTMQFETDFLSLIPGVLFDTHVAERARIGRMVPFLIRLSELKAQPVVIGIDDRTAFCLSPDGKAAVMGSGAVTILQPDAETQIQISQPGWSASRLKCDQLTAGWEYDLPARKISVIPASAKPRSPASPGLPQTELWMTGSGSIRFNQTQSLEAFLSRHRPGTGLILTGDPPGASTDSLSAVLLTSGCNPEVLQVSAASLNLESSAAAILAADVFLLTGRNLSTLSLLRDSLTEAGWAFKEKITLRTPLYALGTVSRITGTEFVSGTDTDDLASWYGKMTVSPGLALLPSAGLQPMVFETDDFYENRATAVPWLMHRAGLAAGLYLNSQSVAIADPEKGTLTVKGTSPLFWLDGSASAWSDSSTYKASGGRGPRQIAAFDNLRLTVSTLNRTVNLTTGLLQETDPVGVQTSEPASPFLLTAYPNPFNSGTVIRFSLPDAGRVTLSVTDLLGRELISFRKDFPAGTHHLPFSLPDAASGIYFCRVSTSHSTETIKMTLIR